MKYPIGGIRYFILNMIFLQFFFDLSAQLNNLFEASEKNVPISAGEVRAGTYKITLLFNYASNCEMNLMS